MFNLKKINKIRKNVKAISPVISVLLMIAVAVVASLVAYAWVMGYMNFQTAKTGQAIQIQATNVDKDNDLIVYVQNVGTGNVKLSTVYINGTMIQSPLFDPSASVDEGLTTKVTVVGNYNSDDKMVIKIVTLDGVSMEYTRNP